MIYFSGASWNLNFVNLFLKCRNYPQITILRTILKLQEFLLLENSFSFPTAEFTLLSRPPD
ncbi:hypothetical protein C4Q31_17780 [Leptospira borgpetersenii serovar Ceylonica]|uniref:Uncharacterized protein n=2 Tax=Leptospira borgpetersenii TaxID=174 RepID=M3HHP6_LEPBO|nr:hypothetical protein C4Q31_17780 [Leptospira borgpetersenii serovar Ceylonica]EKP11834.1 hypothetical protein LEP1GSC128_1021 [Leptospira borgpetersenii str. 200801926]EKQ91506.1 hypothetical protein LEP1GSC101_1150 [Leptospira borgpetersenii str. UI 09149]EKR01013.1 hypothetical protein LEP1GSC121_1701 [Leptospira borgpetersenii serovar Castellonis str. 200801910]EMF97625.1 hypothetical protein LEP1GSC123_1309 [Leptospira borgpetersenii str. 200701203]EMK13588.1 hypothetical protein LEP1GS